MEYNLFHFHDFDTFSLLCVCLNQGIKISLSTEYKSQTKLQLSLQRWVKCKQQECYRYLLIKCINQRMFTANAPRSENEEEMYFVSWWLCPLDSYTVWFCHNLWCKLQSFSSVDLWAVCSCWEWLEMGIAFSWPGRGFLMPVIITAEDSGVRIWRAAGSDHLAFFCRCGCSEVSDDGIE